jgi:hypothetical protein
MTDYLLSTAFSKIIRQRFERVKLAFFAKIVIDFISLDDNRSVNISSDVLIFRFEISFVFIG